MRYTRELAGQVRAARLRLGLTQAELAKRSGTSRVTVARLEGAAGQDVRLETLGRLCDALELELAVGARGRAGSLETGLARAQDEARRLDRRRRHAALAVRLLTGSTRETAALLHRARGAVDRWNREQLCSRHYITRWRRMLAGSPRSVARALLRDDAWTDALFQNSPWGFALGEPRA